MTTFSHHRRHQAVDTIKGAKKEFECTSFCGFAGSNREDINDKNEPNSGGRSTKP